MVFTLSEIIQIGITIVAIGFIFSGYIKRNPVDHIESMLSSRFSGLFNWSDFKFSVMIVAPAIILHEFGHKFAGIALGFSSHYEMFPFGLGLGVFLRVIGSGFLLFAPGYVVIQGADKINMAMIAFAGPLVNLILFAASWAAIESGKFRKHTRALYISKQINLWLFIFNMIPFGPLDGAKVLAGILSAL
jgi:Zn-dependent protease